MAVARQWPKIYSNAIDPGWVSTKMGGSGAPDNLEKGFGTQVWLAETANEPPKVPVNIFIINSWTAIYGRPRK
jgi:NAD(P)-dependent dehydrogenase (short-subunit alcohol dehydrogenase family)